jgi:hypothetical protein
MLAASVLVFVVPITIFAAVFKRFNIVIEIVSGLFSLVFYCPAYLIILNIFALCRIDDISWGTKGLHLQESNKSQSLRETWRVLKYIQVYKFIFWNIILGTVAISLGSEYSPRFFISLVLLSAILFVSVFKIILGVIYLLKYAFCKRMSLPGEVLKLHSSTIASEVMYLQDDILLEICENLKEIQRTMKDTLHDIGDLSFDIHAVSQIKFMNKISKNTSLGKG